MADSDIGSLWFTIGARVDDLMNVIKVVQDQLNTLGGNAQQSADNITSAFNSVWQQFTIGTLVAQALQAAIFNIKATFNDAVTGAMNAELSQVRLATAMEMTGRAANGGAAAMLAWAKQTASATTYTHEETEASATLMAQLTTLSTDGIQQAVKGAMGLATVLGRDLSSATLMVAKAMDGNVQGLRRVGIEIDGSLPKEELIAQVLDKIAPLYARATAEINTQAGAIKQLKKDWQEFLEGLGKAALAAVDAKTSVQMLSDGMNRLNGEYQAVGAHISYASIQTNLARGLFQSQRATTNELAFALQDLQKAYPEIGISLATLTAKYKEGQPAFDAFLNFIRTANDFSIRWAAQNQQAAASTFDLVAAFKKLGITSEDVLSVDLKLATRALQEYIAEGGHVKTVIDDLNKKIHDLNAALGNTVMVETGVTKANTLFADSYQILVDDATGANVAETGLQKQNGLMAYALNVLAVDTMTLAQRIEYLKDATDEQSKALLTYYEGLQRILDSTRDLDVKSKSLWADMGKSANRAVTQMGAQWGNYVDQLVNGTEKFKNIFVEILKSIEATFFKLVGEMVARWIAAMTIMKIAASFLMAIFGIPDVSAASAISLGGGIGAPMLTQQGFEGVVTSPQLFMAGEAGPEYVSVTPMAGGGVGGGGQGGNYNLTFNISALDGTNLVSLVKSKIIPIIHDCLQRRTLTVPEYAVGGR